MTALALACSKGHVDCLTALIDTGASVNSQRLDGCTPLHRAVFHGYLEIVEILLKAGADTEIINDEGQMPVDVACEKNESDIKDKLNSLSAPRYQNVGGKDELHLTAEREDLSKLATLVSVVDLNDRTFYGRNSSNVS